MGIQNMPRVLEALKTYYLEGLRYQLNSDASVFLAQLERDIESVVGSKIVMAMRYGRNGGIGMGADDGTLPTPNGRKTKQAEWETKNFFARFQITEKVIKASKTSRGAFANLLTQEMEDTETDSKFDLSRQCLGDSTGKLCTGSALNGTVLTVDSTRFMAEGMLIDSYTAGAVKHLAGAEVIAVDHGALTVEVDAVGTLAATDILYVKGSKDLELTGLDAVFAQTGNLYGLARATYPWLKAQRTNVAGELEETTIQKAIDDAKRLTGAKTNFLLCALDVRRAYQDLMTAQKQTVNSLKLKGGWSALSYTGGDREVALTADDLMADGKMFCLDLNNWKFYHMGDFEWLDEDGAVLSRVADKAAYEATLTRYCDIGCDKPRGQCELYGITGH